MAEDPSSTYPIHDDDGRWEMGDGVPGPAGAAALLLGDDVTLSVDMAEPSLLVGLTAQSARPSTLPQRASLVLPGAVAHGESITIADTGVLDRLGRLAVLEDTAREHALWGTVSGWWDAEAVLLRAQAPLGIDLTAGIDDRARNGAAAVLALAPDELESLAPALADRVRATAAALAAAVEPLDTALAARLRVVARTAHRPSPSLTDERVDVAFGDLVAQAFAVAHEPGVVEAAALVTRGAPGALAERQIGLDPDQVPPGLAPAGPLRLIVGADNRSATVRLTIPPTVTAPQLWLVVSRRADGTLLALLPMEPVAGGTTVEATIILRAPDDLDSVHVDATVDPALAPPSAARRALRAATARGRVATRAARLGRPDEAALLWLASSQRWADAGDGEREAVARAWAVAALVAADLPADADLLRRDGRAPTEPWAQQRAARAPVAGLPFLAEVMPSPPGDAPS